nr:hypothetical protein [Tanacetum cinerariifolium]
MHKAFPLPVMEFPLLGEVPTASKESSYCQKKRDVTAEKIALLLKSSSNCQSKSYDSNAKRATRIAQSKALPTAADEPASLLRDNSQGEAFPTVFGLDAGQDRENIIKTSAFPYESTLMVTSLDADEGSMQQKLQELIDLCTSLQRQQTQMATKINAQDLEISGLKARIKLLEDKDKGSAELSEDDAPIKGRSMEIGEEEGVEKSTEPGSNETEELVNVLTSMEAANILTSGVAAVSVPPCANTILKTSKRDFSKVKEMEEEMAREDQRMNEQIARDAEIARIHVEEELKMMIDGLDRSNEVIAKHLHEYEQAAADLTIGETIELINEMVKYQDHHAKILKYQAQQSKPLSKKEHREFYMSILRSRAGWKTKHFRGMTLEEIREKFIPVWKQFEDFVPMALKEEGERVKRKGLKLEHGSAKKMKTSEEVSEGDLRDDTTSTCKRGGHTAVYQFFVNMLKKFNREDLNQLWALVIETLSIRQASRDKEKDLWVELKRLFEPDFEDQLWIHTQALMHDPLEWKLYDTCGVHHVFTQDQEIFMLVERDYPLRRGLAIVMIRNKLQVENYSQMANDLIMKIHNIENSTR